MVNFTGLGAVEIIWAGVSSLVLGWIAWGIKSNKKEQAEFEIQEKGKRQKLERKIEEQYLKTATHEILCENAGLKLAKKITDHFDKKLTEHENELKKAIKNNGHTSC